MSDQSHWQLLGMEATEDEEAIRAAYLAELPNYHPEEDPDGFREFREAYETAIAEARAGGEEAEEDTSESGLIVKELKAVLDDFVKRLDPEEWKKILARDECARIDLQAQIGEKLLVLFMEDYYLPQEIWQLLDGFFAWSAQADLLKEKFPANYIDYVLNSIHFEENIRARYFDLSVPDADFDGIINKYYEISNAINNRDMEAALAAVSDAEARGFTHLDVRLQIARYFYFNDENDVAEERANELLAEYPDDERVNLLMGQILLQVGRPAEALKQFENILANNPSHYNARVGEAQAYFDMDEYEVSKQKCLDMLTEDHYDGYVNSIFHKASEKLIEIYEEDLKENPGNQEIIYKLASCYYNEDKNDACIALIENNTPDEAYVAKHAELYFDVLIENVEDYEPIIDKLSALLEDWEKHETVRMRLRLLPSKLASIGKDDLAMEKADIYLQEFPDDPEIRVIQTRIYRRKEQVKEAIDAAEAGLSKDRNFPPLLAEMANIMYDLGDRSEAVRYAELATAGFPYAYDIWAMIINIYYDAGYYDKVISVCEDAERYGMDETYIAKYKAASVLLRDDEPTSGDDESVAEDDVSALTAESTKEAAVETLEKIIHDNPDDQMAMGLLANYYVEVNQYQIAVDLYTRLIELDEDAYYYNSRGLVYSYMDQNESARVDYLKAIELNPEAVYPYYNLGLNLYYEDNLREAVRYLTDAHNIDPNYMPVYAYLIKSYSEMGEIENAVGIADEGLSKFSEEEDADFLQKLRVEKLQAYFQVSAYKEGLAMEAEVLDENGNSDIPSVLTNLAYCHYEQYEDDIAETFYKKAIDLAPDDGEVLRKYAFFLANGRKDAKGAIENYTKAIEYQPIFQSYVRLAKAYDAIGDHKSAKKNYNIALEMLKKDATAKDPRPCIYYFMGECYFGLKLYSHAKRYLQIAIDKAPDFMACNTHFCYEATFLMAKVSKQIYFTRKKAYDKAYDYYKKTIEVSQDREYLEARSEFELSGSVS